MPSLKRCTNIVGSVATFQDVTLGGTAGPGVPAGGTAGQLLSKIDATSYNTQWINPGVATVPDGSITLAKMAPLLQDQVIGRVSPSAGVPETFTVTAAARGVLSQTTVALMLSTLGGQPVNGNLSTIGGLTATANNVIQSLAGTWASRTPTQLTATLDLFTATLRGLVPPPTTSTATKYLRDDGTWVVPPDTTGITQATADTLYVKLAGDTMQSSLTVTNGSYFITAGTAPAPGLFITTAGADGRITWNGTLFDIKTMVAGKTIRLMTSNISRFDITDTAMTASIPVILSTSSPSTALEAASKGYVDRLFSTTTTTSGLVPGSNNVGSTFFLNAAGAWAVPPGGGGLSQATADGLYINATGPDTMTGLLTLTNNATGKALQVNNNTDRGIDLLTANAGLRVMRALTNTPFIEFYDNTGTTNYGFIQYSATTWTIGKGSTVGLTGSTTGVIANLDLSMNGTKVVLKDATGATTIGTIAYGTSLIAGGPANALNILNAAGTAGISVTSSSVQVNQLLNMSSGASIAFSGSAGFINAADTGAALRLGTEGSTRMSLTNLLAYINVPLELYSTLTCYSTLTLAGPPVNPLEAATKAYVDATTRQVIPSSSAATSYTITLADENKLLVFTASTAIAVSVPTNAALPIPIGYRTDFLQTGTGKITVAAVTPGTTTIIATPSTVLRAVGSMASLIKIATDQWALTGDLT